MYSLKNLVVTNEELVIGETQKQLLIAGIKEIKIKRRRKNAFWLFKFYTYTYKFIVILNDLRNYEFYFHQDKLSKAIKYKNQIKELNPSINIELHKHLLNVEVTYELP